MGSATARALARAGPTSCSTSSSSSDTTAARATGVRASSGWRIPRWSSSSSRRRRSPGWRELEAGVGRQLLELNGLIELVADQEQGSSAPLDAAGAAYELLEPTRRGQRWPVGVPDGWAALFQPDAGIVRADLARARVPRQRTRARRAHRGGHAHRVARRPRRGGRRRHCGPLGHAALPRRAGAHRPARRSRTSGGRAPPLPSVVELDPVTRGHAMYSLHDPCTG